MSVDAHIFVVDDEAEVRDMVRDYLIKQGFAVTSVASASGWPRAVRTLRDRHPELARRMAFVTGDTLAPNATRFLKETGPPWLEKPFTPEQVLALVARIETA